MSDLRFRCPQHRTVEGLLREEPLTFDLPYALAHWRWHTERCTLSPWRGDNDWFFAVYEGQDGEVMKADTEHVARMSPAFTLTLIDTLEATVQRHHPKEKRYWDRDGGVLCRDHPTYWPCPEYDAVVTIVKAAGFEVVSDE